VTSFFRIKVCVFCVLLEKDKMNLGQIFFQDLGENTCSLHPALKITAMPSSLLIIVNHFFIFSRQCSHFKNFTSKYYYNFLNIALVLPGELYFYVHL